MVWQRLMLGEVSAGMYNEHSPQTHCGLHCRILPMSLLSQQACRNVGPVYLALITQPRHRLAKLQVALQPCRLLGGEVRYKVAAALLHLIVNLIVQGVVLQNGNGRNGSLQHATPSQTSCAFMFLATLQHLENVQARIPATASS
jgi:hypothetical protein